MRWCCSTNLTTRERDTRLIIRSFNKKKNSVFISIQGRRSLICYKGWRIKGTERCKYTRDNASPDKGNQRLQNSSAHALRIRTTHVLFGRLVQPGRIRRSYRTDRYFYKRMHLIICFWTKLNKMTRYPHEISENERIDITSLRSEIHEW